MQKSLCIPFPLQHVHNIPGRKIKTLKSVDVNNDYGGILKNFSIDEIKNTIQKISNLPPRRTQTDGTEGMGVCKGKSHKERFVEEYRKTIIRIKEAHKNSL